MTLTRSLGQAAPLALALAIIAIALTQNGDHLSAALSLSWIVLGIANHALAQPQPGTASRVWPFAVVVLLLLNLRGVVLEEGPRPVSHMDYVLLISAVLAGQGQKRAFWRTNLSIICLAIASCGLWQAAAVWQHLFEKEFGFRFGGLLINQTAMLAGLGCVCGLAALQLWREALPATTSGTKDTQSVTSIGIQLSLGIAILGCAVVTFATHSRAGIGLIPLSVLSSWGLQQGARHYSRLRHWLRKHILKLVLAIFLIAGTPFLFLASPQGPTLQKTMVNLYGSENRVSDQGRLNLWHCYTSLPFTGNNRFLYGVGYGRAREVCQISLPNMTKPLSHAHNLPLQIWAEAGTLPMLLLLVGGFQLGRRILRQQDQPHAMALSAPLIYGVLFNLVELGMLKVPLLTALFGYLLSGPLTSTGFRPPIGDNRS